MKFSTAVVHNVPFMRSYPRLLIWVLCAILAVGLPAFAPYAMAGDEPCSMSHEEGSAPERDTTCAQYCAAVCAGMVLPSVQRLAAGCDNERVAVLCIALFQSHAGPPALQPPR
jgi:hypothetical protein